MKKLGESLIYGVCCDMMNLRYEQVLEFEFLAIRREIERLYSEGEIVNYHFCEKTGATDYRHNIYIQPGFSHEGGIFIGWQHNSSKPNQLMSYDLKIELNPSKINYLTDENHKKIEFINDIKIYKILGPILDKKVVRIIEFDVAIDLKIKLDDLISFSRQGRSMNLIHGTRYYGVKHKDMYLKIYDKAKERKEKTGFDVGTDLTRLEFSIRPANGNGLTFSGLQKYLIDIDKYYSFALYPNNISDVSIKSYIHSILSGYLQFKDFNHRQKKKIIETLENELITVSINEIVTKYYNDIMDPIAEWCFDSVNDVDLDGFMQRLKYNQNERYLLAISQYEAPSTLKQTIVKK